MHRNATYNQDSAIETKKGKEHMLTAGNNWSQQTKYHRVYRLNQEFQENQLDSFFLFLGNLKWIPLFIICFLFQIISHFWENWTFSYRYILCKRTLSTAAFSDSCFRSIIGRSVWFCSWQGGDTCSYWKGHYESTNTEKRQLTGTILSVKSVEFLLNQLEQVE